MTILQERNKRLFDACSAFAGIVLLWPVMLACLAAAAISTRTTGWYTQSRIGRFGKPFTLYKLRTMHVQHDVPFNPITIDNDSRVTRIGALLRRFKLDELPQLFNVLKGDMSLVGPRPDVEGYADRLQGEERALLALRPGITGPATLKYRDEEVLLARQPDPRAFNDRVLYPDKVRLNLDYMNNLSLRADIAYILMTLKLKPFPAELLYEPES